jgi:hypothetical protein
LVPIFPTRGSQGSTAPEEQEMAAQRLESKYRLAILELSVSMNATAHLYRRCLHHISLNHIFYPNVFRLTETSTEPLAIST